jgi:uncharacterized membrane protein YkvA (DUF1232 family)
VKKADAPGFLGRLREATRALKREVHALALAFVHPRTPWYVKLYLGLVVGYALSPIDLIPDFIPVLGYLDDLILVPLFLALAVRIIPREVLAECRSRASDAATERRLGRLGLVVVALIWVAVLAVLAAVLVPRLLNGHRAG